MNRWRGLIWSWVAVFGTAPVWAEEGLGPPLAAPVPLQADGKAISVDVGHAAPCVADWNGDGKPDLLVGQFGSGKLRIYLNEGTRAEPRFGKFTWFQAGGQDGKVPSG
jgi:hypothetical protein